MAAVSQFRIVQKGKVEIPCNHTLPAGRYVVDVEIRNEGYIHVMDSAFTVIDKATISKSENFDTTPQRGIFP